MLLLSPNQLYDKETLMRTSSSPASYSQFLPCGCLLLLTKSRSLAKAKGFDWKWLPLLRTHAITELQTLSCYQSDNFFVLTLDKADTLYFSYNMIMYITFCCSSFAKIHFKRFPECLFSHQFLKLSAQSSSLLHLSLHFFLPGYFRRGQAPSQQFRYCW